MRRNAMLLYPYIKNDTILIITLMKMGHLDILKQLYGKVLIPNAVYMELTSNEKFLMETSQVMNCDFLEVKEVDNEVAVTILQEVSGLDAEESEAIVMANSRKADLLVMDEYKSRGVAKKCEIIKRHINQKRQELQNEVILSFLYPQKQK